MKEALIKADAYLDALNELRLLVFIECDHEGNEECKEEGPHFHQISLNDEQFLKISDAILTKKERDNTLREPYELGEFQVTQHIFDSKLFDGLNSINA